MLRLMMSTVWRMMACSSPFKGLKSCMVAVLSSICSRLLMPLSTINTLSRLAAKRMAQEGMDLSGA